MKEIHIIESGFITSFPQKLYRFCFSQLIQQWPLNQDLWSVSHQSFTGSAFLNRLSHGPGHGCHTPIYAYVLSLRNIHFSEYFLLESEGSSFESWWHKCFIHHSNIHCIFLTKSEGSSFQSWLKLVSFLRGKPRHHFSLSIEGWEVTNLGTPSLSN